MRVLRFAFLVTLVACSTPNDPSGWERVIGWANPEMSSVQAIRFPSEAVANQPFNVTVTTIGSSSCTRADGATATVDKDVVTVTPYDFIAPSNTPCTRDLHPFPRTVSVTVPSAGLATMRLKTRMPDGTNKTFEFSIEVRAR